jgi:uncharacterized protein YqeY
MSESSAPLKQRIESDMKAALRAQDKGRLGTLRLVLAAVKQREIDDRTTLSDGDILGVLEKMIKQRRDAVTQFEQAGRRDLVDKETAEIQIIQEYLPTALSEAEIDAAIAETIAHSGAASPQEMGKIMGLLKARLQGRADMALVSRKVKAKLGS